MTRGKQDIIADFIDEREKTITLTCRATIVMKSVMASTNSFIKLMGDTIAVKPEPLAEWNKVVQDINDMREVILLFNSNIYKKDNFFTEMATLPDNDEPEDIAHA